MSMRIEDIIHSLIAPVGRLDQTVDTLKFGDPQSEVTGIITAFMPSQHVLEEAVAAGANLIIAHEAPFYNHHDAFEKNLEDDPVFQAKKKFILDSNLAIFRCHDYLHRYQPDGIMEGLIEALDWGGNVAEHRPVSSIVELSQATVREVAQHVKDKLGLGFVRIAGDIDSSCKRVGLLAGYRGGGQNAIPLFEQDKLDLLIYGEGPEWETPEYVRDAAAQGQAKALIVLGHAESEAAGMRLLAERLQLQYPDIPVRFVADKPVFRIL